MKSKVAAAVTTLFMCISALACSTTYNTDVPVSDTTHASDAYTGITPSESTGAEVSPEIHTPYITTEPSPSATPETVEPSQDMSHPSNETVPLAQEPASESPAPEDSDFVRVQDYISSIIIELKYATADNFMGQVIYEFTDAYLRYGTVKKLIAVQEQLSKLGYCLKIWDAFRPVEAQFKLWEACPDATFVANPEKGYSSHSKGNTVDVTLVLLDGTEVKMPTGFDVFSDLADRDYSDIDIDAAENALTLETIMLDCGFKAYSKEWWHYTDIAVYPVEESFIP